jgi:quercetin dioxygenase-like cupin family protein
VARDRDQGRCYIGIVTEGKGWLAGSDIPMALEPGTTFFIPAASEHRSYWAAPGAPLTLVKCFPPA